MRKPILCVDFDGVIHSYASGWKGADVIPDPPVPGVFEWIAKASEHFTIAVYSSRSGQEGGIQAMQDWMQMHCPTVPYDWWYHYGKALEWPTSKPSAFLTIDDRCIQFDGDWSFDPASLRNFKPWNKRG